LKELVCVVDSESCKPNYVFDCLIYVHGRTCATGVGLTNDFGTRNPTLLPIR
jgi:hypothetical protein